MPNPALQRMANPLRGLSASERGRLCGTAAFKGFDFKADVSPSVQFGSILDIRDLTADSVFSSGQNRPGAVGHRLGAT